VALAVEEAILVGAPPQAVWRFLADPMSWRYWWRHCKSAATADLKPLRDGSRLEIALELGLLTFTLRPTVEVASENRTLIWVGRSLGVTGRHAFYLEARPNGTYVRQRESFSGGGLFLFQLLRLERATSRMFKENLRGLKRIAERGG